MPPRFLIRHLDRPTPAPERAYAASDHLINIRPEYTCEPARLHIDSAEGPYNLSLVESEAHITLLFTGRQPNFANKHPQPTTEVPLRKTVCNSPDALSDSCAEHGIHMPPETARSLFSAVRKQLNISPASATHSI